MRDKHIILGGLVDDPCPFCGVPYPTAKADYSNKVRTWFIYVECRYCKARGGFSTAGEGATAEEKTRATVKAVENWKMREACDYCTVRKKVKKRLRRKV